MTTESLEHAFALARGVLANVKPKQYDDPTPCASWDVRRLISHYVGASDWFAECVNNGAAPEDDTSESTDYTQGDLLAAYDAGIAASVAAFGAPGAQDKIIKLPFGELPGAIFMGIATNDVFTHAWDLARATGQSTDLDPAFATQMTEGARLFVQDASAGPTVRVRRSVPSNQPPRERRPPTATPPSSAEPSKQTSDGERTARWPSRCTSTPRA